VRVRGAGYDKTLSFGGTDGGPTHARSRRTQTFFIARTPDISPLAADILGKLGAIRVLWTSTLLTPKGLQSAPIGNDIEQRIALLNLEYDEEFKIYERRRLREI